MVQAVAIPTGRRKFGAKAQRGLIFDWEEREGGSDETFQRIRGPVQTLGRQWLASTKDLLL